MAYSRKTEPLGELVTVNGHKMHVFRVGNGGNTFIFLSGHGTCCPTLDFKPLWSILSAGHKTAVVERAGYGWSETANTPRDIDTVLEETRKALKLSDIKPPYILTPHSLAGLEAIYWAQKYPAEVRAIIGLDSAIPKAYDNFKIPAAPVIGALGLLAKIGIHKPLAGMLSKKSPAAQSGYLTEADIKIYTKIFKQSTYTPDMLNETKFFRQNADVVKSGQTPVDIPIYLFISNANEKIIAGWSELLSDYAAAFKNGRSMILDCGHYVHAYEPARIADEINGFISSL